MVCSGDPIRVAVYRTVSIYGNGTDELPGNTVAAWWKRVLQREIIAHSSRTGSDAPQGCGNYLSRAVDYGGFDPGSLGSLSYLAHEPSQIKASATLRHGRHLSDADRGLAGTKDHRPVFDILRRFLVVA